MAQARLKYFGWGREGEGLTADGYAVHGDLAGCGRLGRGPELRANRGPELGGDPPSEAYTSRSGSFGPLSVINFR